MDSLALLNEAHAAGLEVCADGDRLVVRGPRSAAALAQKLLAHKADVLPLLRDPSDSIPVRPSPLVDKCLDMPLAQFVCEGDLIEVRVNWLEVSLWFVPTKTDAIALSREGISRARIWTAHELMELMHLTRLSAEEMRTIAMVKLVSGADVLEVRSRRKGAPGA